MPAWQFLGADEYGRGVVLIRDSLLFPTAGYDLSYISTLVICSFCISPCSFFHNPMLVGFLWMSCVVWKLSCILMLVQKRLSVRLRDHETCFALLAMLSHHNAPPSTSSFPLTIPTKNLSASPSSSSSAMLTPAQLAQLPPQVHPSIRHARGHHRHHLPLSLFSLAWRYIRADWHGLWSVPALLRRLA